MYNSDMYILQMLSESFNVIETKVMSSEAFLQTVSDKCKLILLKTSRSHF